MASSLLVGFSLGLAVAASPGAMGLLCIRRTLISGWWSGAATGLGTATTDAIYAGVAVGGVTALTRVLLAQSRWLALAGGLGLLALGAWGLRRSTAVPDEARASGEPSRIRPLVCYESSFGLTLVNPTTIVTFAAAFRAWALWAGSRRRSWSWARSPAQRRGGSR